MSNKSEHTLVWWLSQEDCIQLASSENALELPAYILNQFWSRYGRPGRGRLWVDKQFDLVGVDCPETSTLADNCLLCGGIVVRSEDSSYVAFLPGFVTDLELNLYRGEK